MPDVDLYLHVRVLISMILGLSVARLIGGVAGFIQHPGRDRVWLVHLGWVGWALLNVVTLWWWEFRLSLVAHWTFALYLFIIVYISLYYFLAVLLFPGDLDDYDGYQHYFMSRRKWFFGIFALTEILDVIDTWMKGDQHLSSLGPEYGLKIAVFVFLCIVATRTRNLTFHGLFVVGALLYEVSYFGRHFYSLD